MEHERAKLVLLYIRYLLVVIFFPNDLTNNFFYCIETFAK